MKRLQILSSVVLAGQLALQAAPADRDPAQTKTTPPVLRPSEPSDNVVLKLPGAPAPKRVTPPAPAPAPAPTSTAASVPAQPKPQAPAQIPVRAASVSEKPAALPQAPALVSKPEPLSGRPVEVALHREPPKSPVGAESHAASKMSKPPLPSAAPPSAAPPSAALPLAALPPDFAKDSAMFCQKQIGHWKEADARALFGDPLRQRPAYDDKKAVSGRIYAFSDPSSHYKEIELDFDKATGNLRTVFGYPPQMTWKDCLHLWGNKVATADAKQGRTFYSYLNRRLDVLVDQKGKVISLGLY